MHQETKIVHSKYQIKASIKKPARNTGLGIVLAHGAIINRQSLLRVTYSLGDYLCNQLNAYVIAPDFMGETLHMESPNMENLSEIYNLTSRYLSETYDLDTIMGFGHSMGCYIIANALQDNPQLDCLVNYGGPISELQTSRRRGFIKYLVNYLTSFDYEINVENLLNYIFDKETKWYLKEVMLREAQYHSKNYDFSFKPRMFTDIQKIIENYLNQIKAWGKPTMLLFGAGDKITQMTLKHYEDNHVEENILFRHLPRASHITPCMQNPAKLSRLHPVINFYRENHRPKHIASVSREK